MSHTPPNIYWKALGKLRWEHLAAKMTAEDSWAVGPPSPYEPGPRIMAGGRSYPAYFDAAAVLRGDS